MAKSQIVLSVAAVPLKRRINASRVVTAFLNHVAAPDRDRALSSHRKLKDF